MKRKLQYLRQGIWRIRSQDLRWSRALWLRPLRVLILAGRQFVEERCQLRASALTFYTLLSIVPVLAITFAVAKAFGIEERFEAIVTEQLQGHEEVIEYVLEFVRAQLHHAHGGFVAGFGFLLLFWSVFKLLTHIESSFNRIWRTHKRRPLGRRVLDYAAMVVLGPMLLVINSSATVQITHRAEVVAENIPLLSGPLTVLITALVPIVGLVGLLMLLYRYLPRARIGFRAAFVGALVASFLYAAVQWGYVTFQFWMSGYNAIYGSFAALPLFLIWVQLSWSIVLFGVALSFATEHESDFEFAADAARASRRVRKEVALSIVAFCARRFRDGGIAPANSEIARALGLPARLTDHVLEDLEESGVLIQVDTPTSGCGYRPGVPLQELTVHRVLSALDRAGSEEMLNSGLEPRVQAAEAVLDSLDELVRTSDANLAILELDPCHADDDNEEVEATAAADCRQQ